MLTLLVSTTHHAPAVSAIFVVLCVLVRSPKAWFGFHSVKHKQKWKKSDEMSRRKQEKPKPRKNLVEGECDVVQDTLTCGVCQKDFPLADIVRFIQHKVQSCNKENCLLFGDSDSEDLVLNASRRPPISAPLAARKEAPSRRDLTPPNSEDNGDKDDPVDYVTLKTTATTKEIGRGPNQDVKTNGSISEPVSYVCSTCKQTHTSAWALLQHVQHVHGLKIYVDQSPTNSPQTPPVKLEQKENDPAATKERTSSSSSPVQPSVPNLRVPLLERQLDPVPLFPRPSSQELRLDLLGLSSNNPLAVSTPPPLLDGTKSHGDVPHTSTPGLGVGYEPQLDFYSQRLRELAGATSPNSTLSSKKLLQPSFKAILNKPSQRPATPPQLQPPQQPTSTSSSSSQQLQQSSASSTSSKASSTDNQPPSPKLKSCEFCGKSFRFQSNLIVHRRSHTGEKPFKCHICHHACSQASKLKRHMKTHRKKKKSSTAENGDSVVQRPGTNIDETVGSSHEGAEKSRSERQTNGNRSEDYISDEQGDNEDDEEEDDLVEEEEDEEECDEDGEDEDVDVEEHCEKNAPNEKAHSLNHRSNVDDDMVAEDLTKKRFNNGAPAVNNNEEKKDEKQDRKESKTVRHSLLSEVMEKIGLAHIQQYNEAYKQALKESCVSSVSGIKPERYYGTDGSVSNDASHVDGDLERPSREGTRSSGHSPLNFGTSLISSSAFDHTLSMKRLRLDPGEQWRDKERENNLYAGLWIPTVSASPSYRDLYMGMSNEGGSGSLERGKSSTESALISNSPGGSGSGVRGNSSSPRPGPSSGTGLNSIANSLLRPKDQRRNDTCEFCGKVFKNCSNLTVHRRSHTGEKPYKCELCSYACAQSSKLTRHMKTHGRMGKDVFRCRFCNMPFSVPSTLEKHMRKCVVSQGGGTYMLSERDSDSKEMTS